MVTTNKNLIKNKFISYFLTALMIIAAMTAPIGMIPYAWNFSALITNIPPIAVTLSIFFLVTALPGNAILGFYSLSKLRDNKNIALKEFTSIAVLSLLSAIPLGFISYIGYKSILSNSLNLTLSIIIVLVNFAIGFNGVHNGLKDFIVFKNNSNKIALDELFVRTTFFIFGLIMTLTFYLAGTNGLHNLLPALKLEKLNTPFFVYFSAVFLWFPLACLFSNSFQKVVGNIYQLIKSKKLLKNITFYTLGLFIFCIFSGSSFAQMTKEFFSPNYYIPSIFKTEFAQYAANYFLVPLALLVSASVNALALKGLIEDHLDR